MKDIGHILLNARPETKLYSPIYGDVYLDSVEQVGDGEYIIFVHDTPLLEGCVRATIEQSEDIIAFYGNGTTGNKMFNVTPECVLFPSKEQRHWDYFACETI